MTLYGPPEAGYCNRGFNSLELSLSCAVPGCGLVALCTEWRMWTRASQIVALMVSQHVGHIVFNLNCPLQLAPPLLSGLINSVSELLA